MYYGNSGQGEMALFSNASSANLVGTVPEESPDGNVSFHNAIRAIIGVFDGHGGEESSQLCATRMDVLFRKLYEEHHTRVDVPRILEAAVFDMESQILDEAIKYVSLRSCVAIM